MLVRRTGDSRRAEGLNPWGMVRHGARVAMGRRPGDIALYLAALAAASDETLGCTAAPSPTDPLPPPPAARPSDPSSGAGVAPSRPPQARSPAFAGDSSITGSRDRDRERERLCGEWSRGGEERCYRRKKKKRGAGGFRFWEIVRWGYFGNFTI